MADFEVDNYHFEINSGISVIKKISSINPSFYSICIQTKQKNENFKPQVTKSVKAPYSTTLTDVYVTPIILIL